MRLPIVKVQLIDGQKVICSYRPSPQIGENWAGYLFTLDGNFIYGRFKDIDEENNSCVFILNNEEESSQITIAQKLFYLDGYYGDKAELVLNKKINWNKQTFEATDAVEVKSGILRKVTQNDLEKDNRTISSGWDHEHCEICMATIGNCGEPTGYRNQRDEWVCRECYLNYIEKRDVSFIPEF